MMHKLAEIMLDAPYESLKLKQLSEVFEESDPPDQFPIMETHKEEVACLLIQLPLLRFFTFLPYPQSCLIKNCDL